MNLVEIGQRVHSQRKALKLTQGQLAERAGLSRATITSLENGKIAELGTARLSSLLQTLGLTLDVKPLTAQRPTLEDRYAQQAAAHASRAATPSYRG